MELIYFIFPISSFLIAALYFPLGFLILYFSKGKAPKLYALHIISIAIWGIGSFLAFISKNDHLILIFYKIGHSGVIFINIFLIHSALALKKYEKNYLIIPLYLVAFYIQYLNFSDKLFSIFYINNIPWSQPNDPQFYKFFILFWAITVFTAFIILVSHYKNKDQKLDLKNYYLLLVVGTISFIGGVSNFLPCMGIKTIPLGNFLIIPGAYVVLKTIFKNQFLEVNLVLKKSIFYTFLITTITVFYFLIVLLFERILLQPLIGYQNVYASIFFIILICLFFIPIKNAIQTVVDKTFFKKTPFELVDENTFLHEEILKHEKYKIASTLASHVAHEVKTPLTVLQTFIEQFESKKNDSNFSERFPKLAKEELNRLEKLVLQLLDFSKPPQIQNKTFNLFEPLFDVLDLFHSRFIKNHIIIQKSFRNTDISLTGDKDQLKQVFYNIISNSIDAMPTGGTIDIQSRQKGQSVELIFRDTGHGLSNEANEKIFTPFFTTKQQGTGLGLSICKKIIQKHSGTITLSNRGDQTGAEVMLEFKI